MTQSIYFEEGGGNQMPEDPTTEAEAEEETQGGEFVTQSSNRVAVLERLVEGPADPSEVANERAVGVASAQSATEDLRGQRLVEVLETDDERVYGLTAKGERVLFSLKEKGMI